MRLYIGSGNSNVRKNLLGNQTACTPTEISTYIRLYIEIFVEI